MGYNKEQEKALRKRGRGPPEQQWKEVYKILFPLVPEELIPSPRYGSIIEEWESRRRRDLDRMESYLRLELPRGVTRRFEQKSLQLPRALESQVRRQVIEIIESVQADAFQSYRRQDSRHVETYGPDTSCQPSHSNSTQQSQTTDGGGLEATLEVPNLTTMTASALRGPFTSTAEATSGPFNPTPGLQYDLDSSIGGHDDMQQQYESAGWMHSQTLDDELWQF
ncbi:hypothetical protein CGCVW01_v001414 [Colletotrichum viniferum]|nr:hypothetical protein CGCVW01_v001414 [Colletotrichum viniferum]